MNRRKTRVTHDRLNGVRRCAPFSRPNFLSMARTRSEAIADAVARRIMQNTKKHWRTLHADALQELSDMSTTTDKMNTQNSELRPVVVKQTDHKALEGSNAPNDFRSQAAQPVMPPQPAPRGETNDLNEGVGA